MAATRITPITPTSPYLLESTTPQLNTVTASASDATNGNVITLAKDILLRLENTTVGSETVTITSYPEGYGRLATITAFSIPTLAVVNRRFTRFGWGNGSGDLEIITSDAGITVEAYEI